MKQFNEILMKMVFDLKDKLFHLHDVRKQDSRDRRTVGMGIINFRKLFRCLAQLNIMVF